MVFPSFYFANLIIHDRMTTKEISEKLFLSVNTIKYHKKTIQKAFDAKNSNEVLAKAYSEGLTKK